MSFKKGSIVRALGTNKLYEVHSLYGSKMLCREINPDYSKTEYDSVLSLDECELVLEEANDAFNILFEDDND